MNQNPNPIQAAKDAAAREAAISACRQLLERAGGDLSALAKTLGSPGALGDDTKVDDAVQKLTAALEQGRLVLKEIEPWSSSHNAVARAA